MRIDAPTKTVAPEVRNLPISIDLHAFSERWRCLHCLVIASAAQTDAYGTLRCMAPSYQLLRNRQNRDFSTTGAAFNRNCKLLKILNRIQNTFRMVWELLDAASKKYLSGTGPTLKKTKP